MASSFMKDANRIIAKIENSRLRSTANFLMGAASAVGDDYAHTVPAINGALPSEGEMERFYQRFRYGRTVHETILETLQTFSLPATINFITILHRLFYLGFLDEWIYYQGNPLSYSGSMDSQHLYTVEELKKLGFPDWTIDGE